MEYSDEFIDVECSYSKYLNLNPLFRVTSNSQYDVLSINFSINFNFSFSNFFNNYWGCFFSNRFLSNWVWFLWGNFHRGFNNFWGCFNNFWGCLYDFWGCFNDFWLFSSN